MAHFKFLLPIDVSYFCEDSNGFLQKEDYQVSASIDTTLKETLQSLLPIDLRGNSHVCCGGNFMGELVDLNKLPLEIDYIVENSRLNCVPVLFLCESGTSIDKIRNKPRRRPSLMVKRALECRDSGLSLEGSISSFFDIPDASANGSTSSLATSDVGPSAIELHSKSMSIDIGDAGRLNQESESESNSSGNDDVFNSSESRQTRRRIVQIQPTQSSPNMYHITLPPLNTTPVSPRERSPNVKQTRKRKMGIFKREKEPGENSVIMGPQDKTRTLPVQTRKKLQSNDSSPSLPLAALTGHPSISLPKRSNKISFPISPPYNVTSPPTSPPGKGVAKAKSFGRRRHAIRRTKSTVDLNMILYELKVTINDPNGDKANDEWSTTITCSNFTTIGELKQLVNQALLKHEKLKSPNPSLTYMVDGQQYELLNEAQFLQNTLFYAREVRRQSTAENDHDVENLPVLVVTFAPPMSHHELGIYYRISQLTGILLEQRVSEMGNIKWASSIMPIDQSEAAFARRTLHDHIVQVTEERNEEDYALSAEVTTSTYDTPTLLTLKIPVGNQITVNFHYKDLFSFSRVVGIHSCADIILCEIFPCLTACGLVKDNIEDYTLKLSGEESYIHGSEELIAFKDIRKCIVKGEPVHLSVTLKPSAELYRRFDFSWLPLDPFTTTANLHSEVSIAYRSDTQSVWESDKDFELEVVRVENLPFSEKSKVSVEVSLHLGAKLIHSAKNSGWFRQDEYKISFNKQEAFFMKIKNIPKAAKVLVLVRSSTSKVVYWGLLTLYDHLGRFRSGNQVVYLWKLNASKDSFSAKKMKSCLIETCEVTQEKLNPILTGPVCNNPQPKAVRAVINLGNFENSPMYFPSTFKESRNALFSQHPSIRDTPTKRYLAKYVEDRRSSKCYKNLANDLLVVVDWSNFSHCLEVYQLLDELKKDISHIHEDIALQLLDSKFPDEVVREFAVHILKNKLTNEKLEAYLLQLTQALKFEAHHDSALARYLLKKALTRKQIGHFFFWYLKSEIMDLNESCSPSTVRFAVILEAYLKGCGEAMLTRFMDQVEVERSLKMIRLKLHSPDQSGKGDVDKMQEVLLSELKTMEMQKFSFCPVFNPRLKMGGMRIDKCKIMGSAKRPMWLELLNVDSTCLNKDPVRVIFKTGDDLRQDMITLQIFSLFETLWENEGLDLKLITYGCMPTGKNSGFIEVVKNAKTINEVSGVRENSKLYEWIKSHQKNEFGEEDPEKLKQAVNTFIHSCAGYSVATYVLGIGDRHNDNIMVTTSGNLFHIDFGHFLGNIKHFMGFKREWAPFVLTPDFVYVMGGEGSKGFEYYKHLCCRAFLILRRNADIIVNLIAMMRLTGIPELTCVEDTDYVREALALDKTDTEAEQCFRNVIKRCLSLTWTVQVMWAAHVLVHGTRLKKSQES